MTKEQKSKLIRICIGAVLFAVLLFLRYGGILYRIEALWARTALTASLSFAAFLLAGFDVLLRAADCLTKGRLLESPVFVTLACLALFALGDHTEAAAVMLLFSAGDLVLSLVVSGIRRRALPDENALPQEVFARRGNDFVKLPADEAVPGDLILVGPSETVPLDGVVEEGASEGDLSLLSGGSDPVRIRKGSIVVSGLVNGRGPLIIRAGKTAEDSMLQKLSARLKQAGEKPGKTERTAVRLSKILAAVLLLCAVLVSVLPPLITGSAFPDWIRRGSALLAAACPLVSAFAVPLAFQSGTGALARCGVYPEGHETLEAPKEAGFFMPDPDPDRYEQAVSLARKTVKTARTGLIAGAAATAAAAVLAGLGLLSAGPVLLITVAWSVFAVLNVYFAGREA
ncbi:MAG: hypothetical protein J6Z38_00755 [Lachnospiraceae bacterium]|nr:hypothetical protein [Lachnospiraceae bacterium]